MKKALKFAVGAAAAMSILTAAVSVSAQDNSSADVYINGGYIEFEDQGAVIDNGRVLVPCADVFTKLGKVVVWYDNEKKVVCSDADNTVSLKIGSDEMTVNDKAVKLDVPAKIINGRTMVPLRAISESFGAKVEWDGAVKRAYIITTDIEAQGIKELQFYKEITADDGKLICTYKSEYPYLNGIGAGEDKINESFKTAVENAWSQVEETLTAGAKKSYDFYKDNFEPWTVKHDIFSVFNDGEYICFISDITFNYDGSYTFNKSAVICSFETGESVSPRDYVGEDYDKLLSLAEEGITQDLVENKDKYGINLTYVDMNKAGMYVTDAGYTFFFQPDYITPPNGLSYQYTVSFDELKAAVDKQYGIEDKSENEDNQAVFTTEKEHKQATADDGTQVCYSDLEYPAIQGNSDTVNKINDDYYSYVINICNEFLDTYSGDAEEYYKNYPDNFNGWGESITGEVTYSDDDKICILTTVSDYMGGAHPLTYKEAAIYSLKDGEKLSLDDICKNGEDKKRVLKEAEAGFIDMIEKYPEEFFKDSAQNLDINKAGFYLTDEGITFFYGQYEIAPYARGFVEYTVSKGFYE